jgi:hypothetical protein
MNIAIEQPANAIVIEMEDRPAIANEFARLAWSDLCGWLREASEGLRGGKNHDGFEIGDWDSLVWQRSSQGQGSLCLLHNPGHAFWLTMTFDFDLLHLHYNVDGDSFPHDLLAVSEAGGGDWGFRTREGVFLTAEEVSRSILTTLLSCTA